MNQQIEQLRNDLNAIQSALNGVRSKIDSLDSGNSIPRSVETALRQRLGDIQSTIGAVAVTAVAGAAAFNLPNTTGTLPIVIKGKKYSLLINSPLL